MMEMPKFAPETAGAPKKEKEDGKEAENFMDEVVFSEIPNKKTGGVEYRSSAPDRKIVILKETSLKPEADRPYRVKIVKDTKPDSQMRGAYIAEIDTEKVYGDLAREAEQAFAANDLETAVLKLRKIQELQEATTPLRMPPGSEMAAPLVGEAEKRFRERMEKEFDRQTQRLVHLGYPEAAGMDRFSFYSKIEPLKRRMAEITKMAMSREIPEGHMPFIIVVKNELVSLLRKISLMELEDKKGMTDIDDRQLREIKFAGDIKIPNGLVYLMIDVDYGEETSLLDPVRAGEKFGEEGRSGLTVEEGVALITQYPDVLKEPGRSIDLAGSKLEGKKICISKGGIFNDTPYLKWYGSRHAVPGWGVASCAKRKGWPY